MKKQIGPNVVELVAKMQERMVILERKIDILISRVPARQFDAKPQQHFQPKPQGDGNRQQQPQQNQQPPPRKDKVMHKAICADCKKDCEVPFVPTENRPVYCKECYSKRRAGGGSAKVEIRNNAPVSKPATPIASSVPGEAKKAPRKKPAVKKAKPQKKISIKNKKNKRA